jgi:hypothetical protein
MNPWVILGFVLAVGAAAGGGYYKGNSAGKAEVQQAWDKEKAEQYAAYAKGQEEARKREQDMQEAADRLRREKDRETRELTARKAAVPEKSFTDRIANFLSGSLEKPTNSGSPSNSATPSTTPQDKR